MTTNTVPGISALQCVISSLRDTAHLSDEGGELTDQLRELRDWALTAAQPAVQQGEPLAWMDDGTLRVGSEATAYRVVTDATKRGMTASLAANFITPLYAHPAAPAAQEDALDAARYRWLAAQPPADGALNTIAALRAQLAGAQRDSERLDWMIEQCAYVVSDPDCCDGYWLNYARPDGTMWTQATEHETESHHDPRHRSAAGEV